MQAPGMQISRFCASGLDAINLGAAKIAQGADEIVIAGGVESMSRVGMGMSGGAWFMDPSVGLPGYFMPQGVSADLIATKYGFSRDDVDAYAVESQKRAAKAWEKGYFKNSVIPIKDQNGLTILDHDEHMRPVDRHAGAGRAQPVLRHARRDGRLRRGRPSSAIRKSRRSTTSTMPAIRPASSTARPPCCSARRRPARRWG